MTPDGDGYGVARESKLPSTARRGVVPRLVSKIDVAGTHAASRRRAGFTIKDNDFVPKLLLERTVSYTVAEVADS